MASLRERIQSLTQAEQQQLKELVLEVDILTSQYTKAQEVYERQGGLFGFGGGLCLLMFISYVVFGQHEALGPFNATLGPGILLLAGVGLLARWWMLKQACDTPLKQRMGLQYRNPLLDKLNIFYRESMTAKGGYFYERDTKEEMGNEELAKLCNY
jgi:hypothetical protein